MGESITLSWEWILGIISTLIICFLTWIWTKVEKLEEKVRNLEIQNSGTSSALNIIQNRILGVIK